MKSKVCSPSSLAGRVYDEGLPSRTSGPWSRSATCGKASRRSSVNISNIMQRLLETNDLTIAWCKGSDKVLGTGLDVDSARMRSQVSWGENMVGKVLMDYRKNGLPAWTRGRVAETGTIRLL